MTTSTSRLPPGWPAVVGVVFIAAGVLLAATISLMKHGAVALESQATRLVAERDQLARGNALPARGNPSTLPDYASRLGDVVTIGDVVKAQKLETPELAYRTGATAEGQLRTLSTDIQVLS